MKEKSSGLVKIINIILPLIIVAGFSLVFLLNHLYNSRERVLDFSSAQREGSKFIFDDIILDISPRGGDTGSWVSGDVLKNSKGEILYRKAVGTIYELSVINNSSGAVSDWQATVRIPETMYANNTWNGDVEYHQNVKESEQVQTIKLNEFSKYDITLENYTTPTGPLIPLYEGDYFIYYPSAEFGEKPIAPKPDSSDKESSVKVGFIFYIPEQKADYITDFSQGELRFHLQRSVLKNPIFWGLCVLSLIWISYLIAVIIVKTNINRFVEQKKRDEKIIEQIMQTFINFIEAKDPSTMGHSLRVAEYATILAEKMGFTENECKQIRCIALMHDCGKIYIPDEILSKPGKLTSEEYEIMKKHTVYGKEILRDFNAIDNMGTGALCHHERYDGTGYPNGIKGEEIPLIARIIGVCDAFDAMNSRRCYRRSLSEEVIINELKNNRGKQFDPDIVDLLLSLIDDGVITIRNGEDEEERKPC